MNTEEMNVLVEKISALSVGKAKQYMRNKHLQEKVKEYEENYKAIADRFNHLADRHKEVKAELQLLKKLENEYENQLMVNESLKKRCLQYEKDMAAHPDFKGYFKKVEIQSNKSIVESLGMGLVPGEAVLDRKEQAKIFNQSLSLHGVEEAQKKIASEMVEPPLYDGDQ